MCKHRKYTYLSRAQSTFRVFLPRHRSIYSFCANEQNTHILMPRKLNSRRTPIESRTKENNIFLFCFVIRELCCDRKLDLGRNNWFLFSFRLFFSFCQIGVLNRNQERQRDHDMHVDYTILYRYRNYISDATHNDN